MFYSYIFYITYLFIQVIIYPFIIFYKYISLLLFKINKERFGEISKIENKNVLWVHGASVGEILAIQQIIIELKINNPSLFTHVSTNTITGKKIAQENLLADSFSLLPYDFLPFIYKAYKNINPKTLIILEAELWPTLILFSRFKRIKSILLNARISEKKYKKYKLLSFFYSPIFQIFSHIFTQSSQDTERFISLGVHKDKLITLGNIKISNVINKKKKLSHSTSQLPCVIPPTLLAGSIHPGEHKIYLDLFCLLKSKFNNLKIIIAPRHLHWYQELLSSAQNTKYSIFSWEKTLPDFFENIIKSHDIILVGKLGELFALYKYATIFFLGGTFVPIGGHNLFEPAVWGKPCIIGPYNHQCDIISEQLKNIGGLMQVQSYQELLTITYSLLNNLSQCNKMGKNNLNWVINQEDQISQTLLKFNNLINS